MLDKLVDCAALVFQATLPDRRSYGVVVAKRAYQIGRQGLPEPRPEQELLSFGDEAYGEITETSLCYPTDVVPYKPRTDIVLVANAHAPGGVPQRMWSCGLKVHGARPLSRALVVHGPRQWLPRWRTGAPEGFSPRRGGFLGWQLGEAEPVMQVPIRWEHAWGGQIADPANPGRIVACEENPLGCGWIDPEMTDHTRPVPAPQLEWPQEPIRDAETRYTPACFGPVMPAWLPRRARGGTFDQTWMDTQRPWWPQDYDARFHNAAPDALQIDGYLTGGEDVQLFNLVDGMPQCTITLPPTGMVARLGGMAVRMNMDTVLLDIRSPFPEDWLITTTWRLVVPPAMDYAIALDEMALDSERYKAARPAFTPGNVALAQRIEQEPAHV